MYPILEYSSKYLMLEYFAYFHTYTLYIYPVYVLTIYMYILTGSWHALLTSESMSSSSASSTPCVFVCCVGPVHRCVSVSPMWLSVLWMTKSPSFDAPHILTCRDTCHDRKQFLREPCALLRPCKPLLWIISAGSRQAFRQIKFSD
jgi:hypothetical protein